MIRDFKPPELETVHSMQELHRLEITHKATGIRVAGTGHNRYALECKLLELLDTKLTAAELEKHQQKEIKEIPCLK